MRFRFMVVAVCALALDACASMGIAGCMPGATRCQGNTVQVCKTGISWADATNCDDVAAGEGGDWSCGAPKGVCPLVFQCLPGRGEAAPKVEKKDWLHNLR